MKCLICSGKTPRGAKLCLACRSALRRARDDTVCELLPLPRRLDVFAYSHAPTVTGAPPRVSSAVKEKKARVAEAKRTPAPARSLPFDKLQLAALAVAVLVLALLGGILLRQSHDAHADPRELRPSASHDNGPRLPNRQCSSMHRRPSNRRRRIPFARIAPKRINRGPVSQIQRRSPSQTPRSDRRSKRSYVRFRQSSRRWRARRSPTVGSCCRGDSPGAPAPTCLHASRASTPPGRNIAKATGDNWRSVPPASRTSTDSSRSAHQGASGTLRKPAQAFFRPNM